MKNLWRQQKKAAGLVSGAVEHEAPKNDNILEVLEYKDRV